MPADIINSLLKPGLSIMAAPRGATLARSVVKEGSKWKVDAPTHAQLCASGGRQKKLVSFNLFSLSNPRLFSLILPLLLNSFSFISLSCSCLIVTIYGTHHESVFAERLYTAWVLQRSAAGERKNKTDHGVWVVGIATIASPKQDESSESTRWIQGRRC
uniref:(California timema) hypothetical protein n=1 Tax=Timema californicum TaxID=61474 RepID=A0A7R9J340_TIMCA|nr:unnamed protein product [Timema californicum]